MREEISVPHCCARHDHQPCRVPELGSPSRLPCLTRHHPRPGLLPLTELDACLDRRQPAPAEFRAPVGICEPKYEPEEKEDELKRSRHSVQHPLGSKGKPKMNPRHPGHIVRVAVVPQDPIPHQGQQSVLLQRPPHRTQRLSTVHDEIGNKVHPELKRSPRREVRPQKHQLDPKRGPLQHVPWTNVHLEWIATCHVLFDALEMDSVLVNHVQSRGSQQADSEIASLERLNLASVVHEPHVDARDLRHLQSKAQHAQHSSPNPPPMHQSARHLARPCLHLDRAVYTPVRLVSRDLPNYRHFIVAESVG
mmetsp:Transcript_338/g.765  ORF Transcript_338/g.765 Transcript_338/m.765 type:complete len:307 (-) Transcript_338:574-1494(-)